MNEDELREMWEAGRFDSYGVRPAFEEILDLQNEVSEDDWPLDYKYKDEPAGDYKYDKQGKPILGD